MKLEESGNTNMDEPQGQKAKVSALAILAFVLGILSIPSIFLSYYLVLCIAISAIVMGCVALILNKRRQEKMRGKSMTVIGLVISLIWIVSLSTFLVYVTPLVYEVKQKAQFFEVGYAIELFNSNCGYYPPSGAMDDKGRDYCGTMKLCEAVMGRDFQGFHPSSKFKADGLDESGLSQYDPNTLEHRKGPYLPVRYADAYSMADLYGQGNTGFFDPNNYVLCDVFGHIKFNDERKKIGMPILYYKADTSKTAHDVNDPNNPENIYDYKDNQDLLALGVPGKTGQKHPLFENPKIFYKMTRNYLSPKTNKPQRNDTCILLSAGQDGLYGTKDDIANFYMQ